MNGTGASSASPSILVTGANGLVGSQVCASLEAAGLVFLKGVRNRRAPNEMALDFVHPGSWDAALDGIESVFLLRPPAIARVGSTLNAFIDRARARGVSHFVFLSVAGADRLRFLPHAHVERHLAAGPCDWTFLRPGYFAQNLETALRPDIVERDRIYVPAGQGSVAFVDVADIGAVAAACLAAPEQHRGAAYHLTGPEAVGFVEAARLLSAATSREINYQPASAPAYCWRQIRRGARPAEALVQTALHVGLRFGQGEPITNSVATLLGREAGTLEGYCARRASVWMS